MTLRIFQLLQTFSRTLAQVPSTNYTVLLEILEYNMLGVHAGPKKLHTKFMAIVVSNLNRFSHFFRWKVLW